MCFAFDLSVSVVLVFFLVGFIQFSMSHILSRMLMLIDVVRFSFKLCDFLDFLTSQQNVRCTLISYPKLSEWAVCRCVYWAFSFFISGFMDAVIVFRICVCQNRKLRQPRETTIYDCEFGGNICYHKIYSFLITHLHFASWIHRTYSATHPFAHIHKSNLSENAIKTKV